MTGPIRASNQSEQRTRLQFKAELDVAGLAVSGDELERLYEMWVDNLPQREALRAAAVGPEEEPSFIEKPTTGGGGQ